MFQKAVSQFLDTGGDLSIEPLSFAAIALEYVHVGGKGLVGVPGFGFGFRVPGFEFSLVILKT